MTNHPPTLESEAIRPTQERMAKGDVIVIPKRDRDHQHERPARVETQSVLDRYKRRKTLEDTQLDAGYRWQSFAIKSGRFPKLTMGFEGPINGSNDWMTDSQVSAGIQRDKAITYMRGVSEAFVSVIEHVCVGDRAAEAWAIERRLHPMKGIKTLRQALDVAAKYFGITR